MGRTALLIRCATEQADRIRTEAEKERRTISSYVLGIAARSIEVEDRLFSSMSRYAALNQVISRKALIEPGTRTAILVRCSTEEAERIRSAARRRDVPINAFVLQSLKRAWKVQNTPPGVPVTDENLRGTPPTTQLPS